VEWEWGAARGRCSLFSFAGNLCRAFRDICSTDGGAMAEAEEERASAPEVVGAKDARVGSDPENGRTRAKKRLRKEAETALGNHATEIVQCLLRNIGKDHVPSAKMLIDLADLEDGPGDEDGAAQDEYRSLAEVLWKELYEPGTGNTE
jgi:hypothetical protein